MRAAVRNGRIRVSSSYRAALLCLLLLCGIGLALAPAASAPVDGSHHSETELTIEADDSIDVVERSTVTTSSQPEGVVATFTAVNTGEGFISFDEDNLDDAIEEGLAFPEGEIVIEGEIYEDGTWESTDTTFPVLNTEEDGSGFDAEASAPDGLSGEYDEEAGLMSSEGTLNIELLLTGDDFSFDIGLTTEESDGDASTDGLDGSFDAGGDGGPAMLVDNEYTIEEETGNDLLDSQLGLPITEPGLAWFELDLEFDIEEVTPPTGDLTGTVVDEAGEPVPGATVDLLGTAAETETDADGVYSFEDVDAGEYDLVVSAANFADAEQTVEIAGGETTEQDVELDRLPADLEVSIEGDVVSAGEQLDVVGTVENVGGTATTETVELTVGPFTEQTESVELAPGESAQIAETVSTDEEDVGEYLATLTVDGESADTEVVVRDPLDEMVPEATFTAANAGTGLISFSSNIREAVVEGSYFPAGEIEIAGEIYEGGIWQSTDIQIPQLETSADEVEVDVDVPGGVTGEIDRDEGFMNVNGEFEVDVVGADASFRFVLSGTTEESGQLSGDGSFADGSGEVTLMENEFTVDQTTDVDLVDTGLGLPADEPGENWFALELDIDIDDDPTGTLAGTVTDQNGDPVPDATVTAGDQETQTDGDGSYELPQLALGSTDVTVDADGSDPETVTVDIEPDKTVTTATELTVTGDVTGTIQDQDGDPISGATVTPETAETTTETGADGTYMLPDLGVGERTLLVDAPGAGEQRIDVMIEPGETTELVIELERLGSLAGAVTTTGNQPIPEATVTIPELDAETTTGADGTYAFEELPVGTYELAVDVPDAETETVDVEVAAGESTERMIELDLTGTITGTVETEAGDPVADAAIELVDGDGDSVAETMTDEAGNYEFMNIEPGEYGLAVVTEESQQQLGVELPPGGTVERDVTLGSPEIELAVEDVRTTTGAGAEIVGVVENVGGAPTTVDSTLAVEDIVSTSRTVEVEPGETEPVSLELTAGETGEFTIEFTTNDQTASGELIVEGGEVVANFRAEAVGDSFVSFNEDTLDDAIEEATEFPDANEVSGNEVLWIEGEILSGGTWRAVDQNFPQLEQEGLDIGVENRSTMTGEVDPEAEYMSVDADFLTEILVADDGDHPNFEFSISADTDNSNALSGDASFGSDSLAPDEGESYTVEVSLVDNDFVVDDETGNQLADESLGLPSTEPDENFFELNLEMEVRAGELGGGTIEGVVEDEGGEPISGALVRAGGQETTTEPDGSYTLGDVSAGETELTADAPEYEERSVNVEVEEDTTVEQDIQLDSGEPDLEIEVAAEETIEGETLPVEAVVANLGTATGDAELALTVENLSSSSTSVTLGPQESTEISEEIRTSAGDAGEYEVVLELGDETTTTTVQIEEREDEGGSDEGTTHATFEATSTGGFISFDEDNIDDAIEEGIEFPDGSGDQPPILIEGEIADGEWESTNVDFPVLNTEEDGSGFDAEATAPDGLSGEFDAETGRMTAEGTLRIELALTGDSFEFDIDMTTESTDGSASSDGLTGDFTAGADGIDTTLVDNEYTVPTETGDDLLDSQLGLPLTDSGLAWLELSLAFDVTPAEETDETGTVTGAIEDTDGEPIEDATVSIEGERLSDTTDSEGTYELDGVPAGSQTVTVEAAGYTGTSGEVEVEAEETTQESFAIEPAPPEYEVTVETPSIETGESGTVTANVENVGGPGSEEITLSIAEQSTTETVELAAGESTSVSLDWEPAEEGEYSASVAVGDEQQAATADLSVEDADDRDGDETAVDGTGFVATSTGGFTTFTEPDEETAREEPGLTYPSAEEDEAIVIQGTIEDGTWESTSVEFPTMETEDGITVRVSAPDGLSGEIDRRSESMTAHGTLEVEVGGDEDNVFVLPLDATTDESGALSGDATFDDEAGAVELVDNEFIIDDKSGAALVDEQLDLPATDAGENWFELELDVEFVGEDELGQQDDSEGDGTTDDESGTSAFATLGLVGGVVGIGAAGLFVLLVLAGRLLSYVDPDPES